MKIQHLSKNVCPRVLKLAYEQAQDHHVKYSILEPTAYHDTAFVELEALDENPRFGGIRLDPRADVYHFHTHLYTHSLPYEVIDRANGKPVFWDEHDMSGIDYSKDVSASFAPAPFRPNQVEYWPMVPKDWFRLCDEEERQGVVMVTGLSIKGGFRYWYDALQSIPAKDLTLISQSPDAEYYQTLATVREPMCLQLLIAYLSTFEVGLCGTPFPDANIKQAMPNKLFEYLAAGIPMVCLGKDLRMAAFIETQDIGVVVDDPKDFPDALTEAKRKRPNVLEMRYEYTMKREAQKVMQIYRQHTNNLIELADA